MKKTIQLTENELHNIIDKSINRVINEGLQHDDDISKVRELYDMICKWQDSVQGYGNNIKLSKAWRYMDQTVRPYLDIIMYSNDDDYRIY